MNKDIEFYIKEALLIHEEDLTKEKSIYKNTNYFISDELVLYILD